MLNFSAKRKNYSCTQINKPLFAFVFLLSYQMIQAKQQFSILSYFSTLRNVCKFIRVHIQLEW
jgi:hypothetical protein